MEKQQRNSWGETMLVKRIITATVLIVVIMSVLILFHQSPWVLWAYAGITLLAGWEWVGLLSAPERMKPLGKLGFLAFLAMLLFTLQTLVLPVPRHVQWLFWIDLVFWGWILCGLYHYQTRGTALGLARPIVKLITAWVLLATFFVAIIVLVNQGVVAGVGAGWLIWSIAMVAAFDSGAYFAGKGLGKHRIAPAISPQKSWEGVAGGVLASGLMAMIGYFMLGLARSKLLPFVLISVLIAAFSIIGDLYESWLKRQAGVKDSGHLLPGHGGILDRMDAHIFALPCYAIMTGFFVA